MSKLIGPWLHSRLGYQKRKKWLKDFLELHLTNNIYMKQIEVNFFEKFNIK
jgi:hypothetical protein